MSKVVYTSTNGFIASAARAGSAQSKTRPLTLKGVNVLRHGLNDAQTAEYLALTDDTARREYLAKLDRRTAIESNKFTVKRETYEAWIASVLASNPPTPILFEKGHENAGKPTGRMSNANARNAVAATYASGIVAFDVIAEDRTENVVEEMFPDFDDA